MKRNATRRQNGVNGRVNDRVNGRANRSVNDRANRRVNGRVNGSLNDRVNGSVNVNGRTSNRVKTLAGVRRYRNGRLAIDALSRRQMSRWRMLLLDGDWYERQRLRAELLAAGLHVPQTRRPLGAGELSRIREPQPWRLAPR